ncbi:MAG: hypothetical protein VB084_06950 [Syntrophomonadaceae bacterium]|nr:hypothetical protein [Syntrophomonadaceae bacterium]
MTKKLFAVLLILLFTITFSACGGGKGDNEAVPGNSTPTGNLKASGGIYGEPGHELSDFHDAVAKTIKGFEEPLGDLTSNPEYFLFSQDYVMPIVQIAAIGMFDSLEALGKDEGEYREASGGIIEFGEEYTLEQESFNPNEHIGDKIKLDGTLNTNTNTLVLEATVTRGGTIVKRIVNEAVLISDGVLVLQTLDMPYPSDKGENKGNAYFIVCDGKNIEVIYAKFPYEPSFTYKTIVSKGLLDADDMASGYTLIRKLAVENGTATAEKY